MQNFNDIQISKSPFKSPLVELEVYTIVRVGMVHRQQRNRIQEIN